MTLRLLEGHQGHRLLYFSKTSWGCFQFGYFGKSDRKMGNFRCAANKNASSHETSYVNRLIKTFYVFADVIGANFKCCFRLEQISRRLLVLFTLKPSGSWHTPFSDHCVYMVGHAFTPAWCILTLLFWVLIGDTWAYIYTSVVVCINKHAHIHI